MFSPDGVVEHCLFEGKNGNLFVSTEVLRHLKFNSKRLAPIRSEKNSRFPWMYVDRKGRVVISCIPSIDNWADEFSEGLVRTSVANKVGFSDAQGRIVIPPIYDWASPFENGYAEVCDGCRERCATPGGIVEIESLSGGCDHHVMDGGKWFKIDKTGRVILK